MPPFPELEGPLLTLTDAGDHVSASRRWRTSTPSRLLKSRGQGKLSSVLNCSRHAHRGADDQLPALRGPGTLASPLQLECFARSLCDTCSQAGRLLERAGIPGHRNVADAVASRLPRGQVKAIVGKMRRFRALQVARGVGRGLRRGAKAGPCIDGPMQLLCVRPAMEAAGDEQPSLLLLVQLSADERGRPGACSGYESDRTGVLAGDAMRRRDAPDHAERRSAVSRAARNPLSIAPPM